MVSGVCGCFILSPPKCCSKCVEFTSRKAPFSLVPCFRIWYHRKISLTGVSGWTDKKSCWTMKRSKPPLPVRGGPRKKCWPIMLTTSTSFPRWRSDRQTAKRRKSLTKIYGSAFPETAGSIAELPAGTEIDGKRAAPSYAALRLSPAHS